MAYRGGNIDVRAVRQAEAMVRKANGKKEIVATGLSILYPKCQRQGTRAEIWITDEEPASKELWRYRFAVSSSMGQNFSKYRRREEKSRSILLIMYENGQTEIRGETHLVNVSKDFDNIKQLLSGDFAISGEKPVTARYLGLGEDGSQTHTLEIEYERPNGLIGKEQQNLCLPYTHRAEQEMPQLTAGRSGSDNAMVMDGWLSVASSTGKEGQPKGQRSNLWAEMNPLGNKAAPMHMAKQALDAKRENTELRAELKKTRQNEDALKRELDEVKRAMGEWNKKFESKFNELQTMVARHGRRLSEVVELRARCRDVEELMQSQVGDTSNGHESQGEHDEEGEQSQTQFTNHTNPFPSINNGTLSSEHMNMGGTPIDEDDL